MGAAGVLLGVEVVDVFGDETGEGGFAWVFAEGSMNMAGKPGGKALLGTRTGDAGYGD